MLDCCSCGWFTSAANFCSENHWIYFRIYYLHTGWQPSHDFLTVEHAGLAAASPASLLPLLLAPLLPPLLPLLLPPLLLLWWSSSLID